MSDAFLVTLAWRVRGSAEEVTAWAADLAEGTAETNRLEFQIQDIDVDSPEVMEHYKFLGVFVTKGIAPE